MKKVSASYTYEEYIKGLKKSELINILDHYKIKYTKSDKKLTLQKLILNDLNLWVKNAVNLFQNDELQNMKIVFKKKGKLSIRNNYILLQFLLNLKRHYLVFEIDTNNFYIPKDILKIFKEKLKSKKVSKTIKDNTIEYSLFMGIINTYGVVDYKYFYQVIKKKYNIEEKKVLDRLRILEDFYQEFKIYEDKKNIFLCSKEIDGIKECKKYYKIKEDYHLFSVEDYINLYNFKYLNHFRSYKKLIKFISRNYYLEKYQFKTVNKCILLPFLLVYQKNKDNSVHLLSNLIDKHFEFKNDKHKKKFVSLVENVALDYPKWDLKGYSEREKLC